MQLYRAWLEPLIFGSETARRFTQDSPVLPDVWLAFGEAYTKDPHATIDLLLTPHRDSTAGQLHRAIRRRLRGDRMDPNAALPRATRIAGLPLIDLDAADAKTWGADLRKEMKAREETVATAYYEPDLIASLDPPAYVETKLTPWFSPGWTRLVKEPAAAAYNQSTVVARLRLPDLVRAVLPLGSWWKRLRLEPDTDVAVSLGKPEIRQRVAKALAIVDAGRTSERVQADLLWFIRLFGTILIAERMPEPDPDQRAAVLQGVLDNHERLVEAVARALMHPIPPERDGSQLYLVSRNRAASPTVARSTLAIKADAARLLFGVRCAELAWAIVDSGIDATHPAFRLRDAKGALYDKPFAESSGPVGRNQTRVVASFDFTRVRPLLSDDEDSASVMLEQVRERHAEATALGDAGTMAMLDEEIALWESLKRKEGRAYKRLARVRESIEEGRPIEWDVVREFIEIRHAAGHYRAPRNDHGTHVAGILAADWKVTDHDGSGPDENLVGVCPDIRLYDLRILDERGRGDEFAVMAALQFLRFINSQREQPSIHGANLSLSIKHDVANYACGRTPVCDECERVVGSGVVVVAAAGNDGYTQFTSSDVGGMPKVVMDGYRSISISDPGNADGVITVGATHRFQPHTYGVSYFSSRGPTGDGRIKPDLVAPGEKIIAPVLNGDWRPKDGTSMAAPHVSGAAALLLARHRELIGQTARVKQILCKTATDLGRERYFQGHGMVDILRALQSV